MKIAVGRSLCQALPVDMVYEDMLACCEVRAAEVLGMLGFSAMLRGERLPSSPLNVREMRAICPQDSNGQECWADRHVVRVGVYAYE